MTHFESALADLIPATATTLPLETPQHAGPGPHPPIPHQSVFSYPEVLASMWSAHLCPPPASFATPSWDNIDRRQHCSATILSGSIPAMYSHWLLSDIVDQQSPDQMPMPIVFINASDECAEWNHLKSYLCCFYLYFEKSKQALVAR